MKAPEKRDRIAGDLSARIISGAIPAGSRLPAEKTLAGSLGVSRDTVRSVLQVLENARLVERIAGRGTFVRGRGETSGKVISFLLPCAEILADRIGYRAAMATRELLCGAIREAGKRQMRVETVAVSPTNRNDDIDFTSLRHLDSSSRVIVFSRWYAPIFDFLGGTGARTVLITAGREGENAPAGELPDSTSVSFSGDPETEVRTAADFLRRELHCRRICFLTSGKEISASGFFDIVRPRPHAEKLSYSSTEEDREFQARMRELYAEDPFDGIFLAPPYLHGYKYDRTLNRNLGLPEHVRVLLYLSNPFEALRDVPCLNYDFQEIGSAAVRALCGGTPPGGKYVFQPLINYLN